MKKIVVLAIALALVVGMPLLASEFTFGGDVDWGFGSDFDTEHAPADYNATFDAKATVDDFNTVGFSVRHDDASVLVDVDTFRFLTNLEKAQLATNLGSALKLPVSLTSYAGFYDFGSEEYASITGYDLANLAEFTGRRWQWAMALGVADLVTIEAATDFEFALDSNDIWLGAHGVFGPVSAEVYYENIAPLGSSAIFGLSALVQLAVMEGSTLKVAGAYETNIDTGNYALGGAVKFDYGMFGVGVDFSGNDVDAFELLAAELSIAPLANVGVDVGVLFNLPADDVLDNVDASVWYKAGAATWRVGYQYAPDGVTAAASWNAVAVPEGGLYIKAGLDY